MFAGVIAKTIAELTSITNKLAVYQPNTPAIFTGGLPDDAKYPAVLITEEGGNPWGCRSRRGAEMVIEVKVFTTQRDRRGIRSAATALLRKWL